MQNNPVTPDSIAIPTSCKVDQRLLTNSIAAVIRYNVSLSNTPLDLNHWLHLLRSKEAETSSRIEGANATFEDVVRHENGASSSKNREALQEVTGVRYAIKKVSEMIEKENLPFSNRVVRELHREFMTYASLDQGVPGEFRKQRVRVGNHFPPEPHHVPDLMSDLEKYVHDSSDVSPVVKAAVVHAQFEIIHPFLDGNGRTGRLLIPILLKEYGLTDTISFFLSAYFERNRGEYYIRLENITKEGDWNGWVNFFLSCVVEYGTEMQKKVNRINELYMDGDFLKFRNVDSQHIKNFIFRHIYFTVPEMLAYCKENGISLANQRGLHGILASSPNVQVLVSGKGMRQTQYVCRDIVDVMQNIGG